MAQPELVDEVLAMRLDARGIRSREVSRNLDKAGLIRWHQAAEVEFRNMVRGSSSTFMHMFMDPERPAAPLASLEKIRLSELNENVRKRENRVCFQTKQAVYGKFCAQAFKTVGLLTVLEDEHGDAVLVAIDNAVPTTASEEEVRARFPEGMQVAIREPVFRQLWKEGTVGLSVANPADIVPVGEGIQQPLRLLAAGKQGGPVQFAEACRAKGKELFGRKLWKQAAHAYHLGITVVESGMRLLMNAGIATAQDLVPLNDELTLLYSNSSEVCLRLGSYKEALENAEKSLTFKPGDEKSVMRKARSLHGMQKYEEVIACLEALELLQSPIVSKASITAGMENARTAMRQRSGIYELDAYFENKDAPMPDCVQFVGPVELKFGSAHGRRGLFATRSIKPGELLVVSKALAVGQRPKSGPRIWLTGGCRAFDDSPGVAPPVEEGYVKVFGESARNAVALAIARAHESGRFAHQLYSLQGCEVTNEVPPLSLFTEEWEDAVKYPEVNINVRRIREIVLTNTFRMHATGTGEDTLSKDVICLQGLGSFFNHSCAPNCYDEHVGDLMFVSSTRDIQAGDELTISYFKLFHTIFYRRVRMERRHFPFHCECPRCQFEDQAFRNVPALGALGLQFNKDFEPEKDPSDFEGASFLNPPRPLVQSAELAFKLEAILKDCPAFSGEQKDWIRCSFAMCYLVPFLDRRLFGRNFQVLGNIPTRSCSRALSMDEVIRALSSVDPGPSGVLAFLAMGWRGELQTEEEDIYSIRLLEGLAANIYRPVKHESFQKLLKRKSFLGSFANFFPGV